MKRHAWLLVGAVLLLVCLGLVVAMTDPVGVWRLDRAQRELESGLRAGISIEDARQLLSKSGIKYRELDAKESLDRVLDGQHFSQQAGDRILDGKRFAGGVPCTHVLGLTMSFSPDGKLRSRLVHRYYWDCV